MIHELSPLPGPRESAGVQPLCLSPSRFVPCGGTASNQGLVVGVVGAPTRAGILSMIGSGLTLLIVPFASVQSVIRESRL